MTITSLPDRSSPPSSNELIALAPSMIEAVSRAHAFAPAATPIVLCGESGSGKSFFAEYIHRLSGRVGSMVAFSVGLLTPQLAVDELFGHVRGAYTDARSMRAGLIATAGAGTLLLDDLHALDLGVQKQLLQVLDRGIYNPVGSDRVQTVACRVILAMTDDPDRLMRKGVLLKDLRYRFGGCAIAIPPLRERRKEIPLLARHALYQAAVKSGVDGPVGYTDAALALLCECEFEGNVRELEGAVLSAYLLARTSGASLVDVEHLSVCSDSLPQYKRHGDSHTNRLVVEQMLRITGGNVRRAAQMLGVSRSTVSTVTHSWKKARCSPTVQYQPETHSPRVHGTSAGTGQTNL